MNIVLTGGAGFIGSNLLERLNHDGYDKIYIVDNLGTSEKWKNLVGKSFIDYIPKEKFLNLYESDAFGKIDQVIHLGACSSTTNSDATYLMENNYQYSKQLTEISLAKNIRPIVASSAATYGDGSMGYNDGINSLESLRPLNMYGYSKHLFDLWAKRSGAYDKTIGLKFFNIFGPNEQHKGDMRSVICKQFPQIKSEGKMRLFKSYKSEYPDGGQMRDFMYVKDAVDVVMHFVSNRDLAGIYNVGSGVARTWNDVANAIFSALGVGGNIEYIDMPEELRGKYQYETCADVKRLRESSYNQKFMSLADAIKDYVKYFARPF